MHLTVVDAFTDRPFSGNPAAVAILEEFPADSLMQDIAAEMNLSETAFAVGRGAGTYELRWFTPTVEVDLCGHATLATAHVLGREVVFRTRSGPLACRVGPDGVEMDFPAWPAHPRPLPFVPTGMENPVWTGTAGDDWLVELASEADVVDLSPDLTGLAAAGRRGFLVTARAEEGRDWDIVSRFFAPNSGVPEDPVTGSAHCALAPYWAPRLGRDELSGYQASRRGGRVGMRLAGDRVTLSGRAVTVSEVEMVI